MWYWNMSDWIIDIVLRTWRNELSQYAISMTMLIYMSYLTCLCDLILNILLILYVHKCFQIYILSQPKKWPNIIRISFSAGNRRESPSVREPIVLTSVSDPGPADGKKRMRRILILMKYYTLVILTFFLSFI